MPIRRALTLASTLLFCVVSLPAAAQEDDPGTRSAGRKLAIDGIALFQKGNAVEASQKLEKAYQLVQLPSVALWSGRALEARGLLVEASERYRAAARLTVLKGDQEVQAQGKKDAARELEKLLPRIPVLVIDIIHGSGDAPTVTLDGKSVPPPLFGEEQPVNPGTHEIKVSAGEHSTLRQVALKEGDKKRESIDVNGSQPTAAAPPTVTPPAAVSTSTPATSDASSSGSSSRKTLAYVALAAGGAGLVVGGVTGALALGKHSSLADSSNCQGDVCLASERDAVDSLGTLRTVSSIGFIAGGVLATTGLVLLLTGKSESAAAATHAPRIALRLAPQGVSLAGAFQ
jgi:hypothetical protein